MTWPGFWHYSDNATFLCLSEPVCTPQMRVIIFLGVVVLEKMSIKIVAHSRE